MNGIKLRSGLVGACFGLAALTAAVAANEAGIPKAIGDGVREEFNEITQNISQAYRDFLYQHVPSH